MTEVSVARPNRARREVLATDPAVLDLSAAALEVLASVPAWWANRAAAAGLEGSALDVYAAVGSPCPVDLTDLDVHPREDLVDASPEVLADAYVVALDASVRSAHGRHYTPPLLAEALWRQAVEVLRGQPVGLVLDPASGAGVLLLPPLRTWLARQGDTQPELVLAAVTAAVAGRDLDAAAVWLGSVILAAELLPVWARVQPSRRRPLPALLHVEDGLAPQDPPAAAIVMNPPYGRVRLSTEDRDRWSHALSGHANLYGLFVASAIEQVAPGGVVSALIPAGWLGGAYSKNLRRTLGERAPLRRLTHVTERDGVFSSGVLQETVLATFAVGGRRGKVRAERVTVNGHAERESIGTGAIPKDGSLPWLLPRDPSDVPLVKASSTMTHRLADYGWKASTGPLVWNRHKDQISATATVGASPILWAADVDGGQVHQDPRRDHQRYLMPRTDRERDVLVLDRPAVLLQRTTAPEQDRRLVVAALDQGTLDRWGGQVIVENHVNVLTCSTANSALNPRVLAALLNSRALDRLYRCLTGSVAVSAYELAALPVPSPDQVRRWHDLDDAALARAIDEAYEVASA
ncbi:Eco57I restriction-modification methylase domain-containing protein [Oryzihumus leptocrescens]|uniref:site-specific DNA-methyltransferase (adenine-specific) n=1 Tax=Oryzihumus leptocrescens TaxID=297536 RepID=A0A542ZEI3_9MICO|nr:N-6 DNA methylase [Oryzihumus leptocrescens]TQL58755.1 adenine-specific DNA-methyltransferase [Oryzihumus leptocrescens]